TKKHIPGAKEGAEKGNGFKQAWLIEVGMRGDDVFQDELFSYGGLGERVPAKHPLRRIRDFADGALGKMSSAFEGLYSKIGRPSIPPEQLLRALLLQMLYSVRSERMLVEQLEYNLLFAGLSAWRWTMACGPRRPSRRIASVCCRGTSPRGALPPC